MERQKGKNSCIQNEHAAGKQAATNGQAKPNLGQADIVTKQSKTCSTDFYNSFAFENRDKGGKRKNMTLTLMGYVTLSSSSWNNLGEKSKISWSAKHTF